MAAPNADPGLLADVELLATGMDEVELSDGELLMESTIALEGDNAVRAPLNHSQALETTLAISLCLSLQGFNDQPLIGIGLAYL